MTRFIVTPVHGEHGSVFHVVDSEAPEGEQPAVVANSDDRREAEGWAKQWNADDQIEKEREREQDDIQWRREIAIEEGMLNGIESYNDWREFE